MGVPAPQAILLLCAAASLCQAYFQIAKELLPLAQTPLSPLVLGGPGGPGSAVSPLSPPGHGLAQNTSDDFLVYHSAGFAGGRGLSIVTTPERIQQFAKVRAPAYANDFSSPPYEERQMAGKGRGLVATRTLHRGDRIFADTPILLLDAEAFDDAAAGNDDLAALAVDKLPPAMQKRFWDLHARPGDDPVADRIDPNAFELHMGDDTFYGVLPEMAVSMDANDDYNNDDKKGGAESCADQLTSCGAQRLNHDCRPNAVYFFDEATLTQRVHALTDIAPGAEISITYISPLQSRAERLSRLRASWGFNCSCSACSQPPELAALSDRRVAEMDRLLSRLRGDEGDDDSPPPQMAEALVSLFRQERLYADVHEALVLAARAHCAAGHYWHTLRWAHLAAEASALWDGADSPDAVQMARLAERPEGESCWMRAVKM
ncbi:hypothetical protein J3459_016534 [Metarhizium acridum]|uniref:uncharacterized protein n=1 Tax=Metarhizium acridum TaxID=92637 RepID=UPI001C6AC347|nr:hypothetical protein J3459_016534 [Metarhizium acridum]KAG8411512.1 hypothetical protein J3458_015568 [Metarhizium acridum]